MASLALLAAAASSWAKFPLPAAYGKSRVFHIPAAGGGCPRKLTFREYGVGFFVTSNHPFSFLVERSECVLPNRMKTLRALPSALVEGQA